MTEFKHTELTEQIIQAFYKVYNTIGYGFLEKVYVKALVIELKKWGENSFSSVQISVQKV